MRRDQMEHILRAAAAITNEKEFVVIGSQALLAIAPDLPPPLNKSMELDLYPLNNPAKAELIDGTIGELSPFDETFGCHAHGVAPETAILPNHWRDRIIRVESENTGGAVGLCVSPADLAVAKLAAGREKDLVFVSDMIRSGLLDKKSVADVLVELGEPHRSLVEQRLQRA